MFGSTLVSAGINKSNRLIHKDPAYNYTFWSLFAPSHTSTDTKGSHNLKKRATNKPIHFQHSFFQNKTWMTYWENTN